LENHVKILTIRIATFVSGPVLHKTRSALQIINAIRKNNYALPWPSGRDVPTYVEPKIICVSSRIAIVPAPMDSNAQVTRIMTAVFVQKTADNQPAAEMPAVCISMEKTSASKVVQQTRAAVLLWIATILPVRELTYACTGLW